MGKSWGGASWSEFFWFAHRFCLPLKHGASVLVFYLKWPDFIVWSDEWMHISSLVNKMQEQLTAGREHLWEDFHAPWTQRDTVGRPVNLSPRIPSKSLWELFLWVDSFLVVLLLSASSFPGRPIKSLKSLRCFKCITAECVEWQC